MHSVFPGDALNGTLKRVLVQEICSLDAEERPRARAYPVSRHNRLCSCSFPVICNRKHVVTVLLSLQEQCAFSSYGGCYCIPPFARESHKLDPNGCTVLQGVLHSTVHIKIDPIAYAQGKLLSKHASVKV